MSPVELTKSPDAPQETARPLYTVRAELVLARPDHRPLASPGFSPDPLQRIAAAMAGVRHEDGEEAEVVLDLVPVPDRLVARRRRRLMARAKRRGPSAFGEAIGGQGTSGAGMWSTLVEGLNGGRPSGGSQRFERVPRQVDLADGVGKFVPGQEVFAVQLLVRVVATHPARAQARLHQLLAAMEAWSGKNRWVPVGPRRTSWRPYSNVWWRRRGFDRRFGTGEFAPAKTQWVTAGEIAGLLKPPTVHCAATNVARCGGVVPAAPSGLPEWTGQRDILPLGMVTGPDGRTKLGGVHAADILFGAFFGKSGFGKTELGLVQAIARAYAGLGIWFLDPHGEAWARARPYLAHPAITPRLWAINLATPKLTDKVASWNPLSMEGRRIEEVQDVIGAVVGGIVSAQGWANGAPRARTILSNAVRVLAELSFQMLQDGRPDLQPTLFQIKSLLTDDAWREEVLAHMPPEVAKFWRLTFPDYAKEAVPTVTNILDRLDASLSLRAFLGSPRSTYNVRRAMDTGQVVFVCPSGTGESDDLICSLLMFDLFLAGLSRKDTPRDLRRSFWAWADELTAIDGAAGTYIAKVLEQLRKYEVRFMGMTQMAMRLKEATRQALLQNQSILSATGADTDEAKYVTSRFPHVDAATVEGLRKYQYVMSTMLGGERTTPFRVSGIPVDEVYADYYNPEGLEDLDAAIDRNLTRRPVQEIVDELATLDDRILEHLAGRPVDQGPATAAQSDRPQTSTDIVHRVDDAEDDDRDEVA